MEKRQILIVDDELELAEIMAEMLDECGYCADIAGSAAEAYDMLSRKSWHLVILDISLPDSTGFEICKELRRVSGVPVIFASARKTETDRISSFDIGGDDYLEKPYSMKELLSRVNALMRRAYGSETDVKRYTFGDVAVNPAARSVTKGGNPVQLAQREYDLLLCLCRYQNTAVPKEKLLTEVWGAFSEAEPSTLTVHIRWLREKLEDNPAAPQYIKTVWKLGYMLEADT